MRIVFALLVSGFLSANPAYADRDAPTYKYVEKLFLEGKYERVAREADSLIEARAVEPGEAYYIKGLSYLKLVKFSEARDCFETVIAKFPRSKKVFDANVGIGDSYLLAGDTDSAAKIYNKILNQFGDDKNIAVVHSRLAGYCGKAASAEKAAPPISRTSGYFSVQVGSFKNRSNAERLAHKLHRAGYDSYMEMPLGPYDKLYRVKVEKYRSKEEATRLAARLKRSGYSTKICANDASQ